MDKVEQIKAEINNEIEALIKKFCSDFYRELQLKIELVYQKAQALYDPLPKEQPSEGLEKAVEHYWNLVTGFQPNFAVLNLRKKDLMNVAQHFAEWGAEHFRESTKKIEPSEELENVAEWSEDERIRKYIVKFVELEKGVNLPPDDADKMLAYLEKQKDAIGAARQQGYEEGMEDGASMVENAQKEQMMKKAMPMEIRFAGEIYKVHGKKDMPGGAIGYIIEDEPGHYDCITNPDEVLGGGYGIKSNGSPYPLKETNFDQPHWKPSAEQMEALMLAIEGKGPAPTSYLSRRLEDLYEGLANTYGVECDLKEDEK